MSSNFSLLDPSLDIFQVFCDPQQWDAWRAELHQWREQTRRELACDGAL